MKVSTITGWVLSIAAVAFVVLLTGVGSKAFTDDPPAVSPYAAGGSAPGTTVASGDAALVAAGQDVYASSCARCHGFDLSGGTGPAIGAGSNAATLSTGELTGVITEGRGRMPSWGSRLDVEEIAAVVAYLEDAHG